jgi:hypothetical protein
VLLARALAWAGVQFFRLSNVVDPLPPPSMLLGEDEEDDPDDAPPQAPLTRKARAMMAPTVRLVAPSRPPEPPAGSVAARIQAERKKMR